tara:strand:- start:2807 stop:3286 length:480 start_codon:yes stop_codon:yes gene_type:complete
MMNKKGISPLIATVLIIGFTVVLAAVVMNWGLDFFKGVTEETEQQTQQTLICASDLMFEISDVDCAGKITVINRGQIGISSLVFMFHTPDGITTVDTSEDEAAAGIPKFGGTTFDISTDLLASATKVEAIATVESSEGEEPITCPTNVEDYVVACSTGP